MPYIKKYDMNAELELRTQSREAIKAATQLGYDPKVIQELKAAKTVDRISVIMCTARNNM